MYTPNARRIPSVLFASVAAMVMTIAAVGPATAHAAPVSAVTR